MIASLTCGHRNKWPYPFGGLLVPLTNIHSLIRSFIHHYLRLFVTSYHTEKFSHINLPSRNIFLVKSTLIEHKFQNGLAPLLSTMNIMFPLELCAHLCVLPPPSSLSSNPQLSARESGFDTNMPYCQHLFNFLFALSIIHVNQMTHHCKFHLQKIFGACVKRQRFLFWTKKHISLQTRNMSIDRFWLRFYFEWISYA